MLGSNTKAAQCKNATGSHASSVINGPKGISVTCAKKLEYALGIEASHSNKEVSDLHSYWQAPKNERIEHSQYSDDKLNYDLIDGLT
jgi:spore coat protein U-like protein